MLVTLIGPGVLAGVIAIGLRSIGFCAKLLYEAIEEIDAKQVEAITATGASRWQVMAFGIVPQILPAFAGISVFRWDINIRESTVLGLVGAGGIGLQLQGSLNTLAWPQVTLILIVILFAVVVGESDLPKEVADEVGMPGGVAVFERLAIRGVAPRAADVVLIRLHIRCGAVYGGHLCHVNL